MRLRSSFLLALCALTLSAAAQPASHLEVVGPGVPVVEVVQAVPLPGADGARYRVTLLAANPDAVPARGRLHLLLADGTPGGRSLGAIESPEMGPGESHLLRHVVRIPDGVAPGTYGLWAQAAGAAARRPREAARLTVTQPERPTPSSLRGSQRVLEQDSLALVALYEATGGPGWTSRDNWLTAPVSSWHGVTVANERVTGLSLTSNGLTGAIPPEVSNLDALTNLILHENSLTGTLPPALGQLTSLLSLSLEYNQLEGTIPAELGELSQLRYLGLFNNALTGAIPESLGQLSELSYLLLTGNGLTGSIPDALAGLSALQNLELDANALTGTIPPELGQLSQLSYLWLGNNNLTGSIPPELGQLALLQGLYLYGNDLSGSIPPEFGQLTRLEGLSLYNNDLSGSVPSELGQLALLERLVISDNEFTGGIPPELGQLSALTYLSLTRNGLTGPIPDALAGLSALRTLALGGNQLSGAIPGWIGGLNDLEGLYLWGNELAGGIPPELGQLSALTYLSLTRNGLTGPIPDALAGLNALQTLALGGNQLTGAIPGWIGGLDDLEGLYLTRNGLTGPIPDALAGLSALRTLALGGNQLSGAIPGWIGGLDDLEGLYLWGNDLEGPVPADLGALANLSALSVRSSPGLSGPLPQSLMALPLTYFAYEESGVCAPGTAPFQSWLAGIETLSTNGQVCPVQDVQVTSLEIDPSYRVLDVSEADGTVTIRVGVASVEDVTSVTLRQRPNAVTPFYASLSLVAGTATDGTWEATVRYPRYTPGRAVSFSVRVHRDGLPTEVIEHDELRASGYEPTFIVTSDPSDTTPPTLAALSVEVDGRASVTVSARFTDDLSGVPDEIRFRVGRIGSAPVVGQLERVSGNGLDGEYTGTASFSTLTAPGTYTVALSGAGGSFRSVRDRVRNSTRTDAEAIAAAGFTSTVEVAAGPVGDVSATFSDRSTFEGAAPSDLPLERFENNLLGGGGFMTCGAIVSTEATPCFEAGAVLPGFRLVDSYPDLESIALMEPSERAGSTTTAVLANNLDGVTTIEFPTGGVDAFGVDVFDYFGRGGTGRATVFGPAGEFLGEFEVTVPAGAAGFFGVTADGVPIGAVTIDSGSISDEGTIAEVVDNLSFGRAPVEPADGAPGDGATDVSTTPTLAFTGSAPENRLQVVAPPPEGGRSAGRVDGEVVVDVTVAGTSYTVPDGALEPNRTYLWRVAPVVDGETGAFSAALSFTTRAPVSVGESPSAEPLAVGPNPARSTARVRFALAEAGPARVVVYDMLGREVAVLHDGALGAGAHEMAVGAGRLSAGSYLVRLEAAEAAPQVVTFVVAR